jgi:hypothetical protein
MKFVFDACRNSRELTLRHIECPHSNHIVKIDHTDYCSCKCHNFPLILKGVLMWLVIVIIFLAVMAAI